MSCFRHRRAICAAGVCATKQGGRHVRRPGCHVLLCGYEKNRKTSFLSEFSRGLCECDRRMMRLA